MRHSSCNYCGASIEQSFDMQNGEEVNPSAWLELGVSAVCTQSPDKSHRPVVSV